ncbi:MAG: hypothetical protein V4857_14400 [Pseudomonadota bacterium]
MRADDYDEFAALLDTTFDMIGKSPAAKVISGDAKAMFFEDMARYSLTLVRSALAAHRADSERGKWTPSPADLIFQIEKHQSRDNRPKGEEAWALCLTGMDEQKTVVWTQECASAFALARPVLDSSGAISARKTFLEIYERLVVEARQQRAAAQWIVSAGLNKDGYAAAVKRAATGGLLLPNAVALLLPAPVVEAKGETFTLSPREQLDILHKAIADGEARKQARLDAAIDGRIIAENAIGARIQRQVDQHLADDAQVERIETEMVARAAETESEP